MSSDIDRPAAIAELAPSGTLRVALNIANAATVSQRADELLGPAPRLAEALGRWCHRPVEIIRFKSAGAVVKAAEDGDAWDVAFLATDPAREASFHFTPPYLAIEAVVAVNVSSCLHSVADLDMAGVRIASSAGAAYDLVLQRTLKAATRVAFGSPKESIIGFDEQGLDAVAGVRETLEQALRGRDDVKLLNGKLAEIKHALAVPRCRTLAAPLLDRFVIQYTHSREL